MKTKRILYRLCAAVLLLTMLFSTATAAGKTIAEQMAENSAAWWIAHDAGDKELCDKLHKANEELAKQAAGNGGTADYGKDGTWTITDAQGNKTASASTETGKSNTVTYATTSATGRVNSYSTTTFADASIQAMLQAGGTNDTLKTGYNNAAAQATANAAYGDLNQKTSAAEEISVAKQLLGLTDQQATALQRELEAQKQAYALAQDQYQAALARGNTAAAAAAKQRMDNAHTAAENARAQYSYSADQGDANDGGYFHGGTTPAPVTSSGYGYRYTPTTCGISVTCGAGGSVSPAPVSGTITVNYGADQRVEFIPDTGYRIKSVTVDGVSQGAVSAYTFRQITAAHSIAVEFEKQKFEITASAGAGGSISPSGKQTVEYGSSKTFTITPNTGYEVTAVYLDGVNQGRIGSYTFGSVTAAHNITAEFGKQKFEITASAGAGGSISPSGKQTVEYGSSKTFTITPNTGYEVLAVYVDGVNQGRIGSYTFSGITSAHSITVSFRLKSRLELGTPAVTDASGAGLDGTAIKSGYGIYVSCPVTVVNVTQVKLVLSYNFGGGAKQITLQETSAGCYALPVNPESATGARCLYIPVGTKDGKYTLTLTLSGLDADGKAISASSSATVTVKDSMYEDDFTGDR